MLALNHATKTQLVARFRERFQSAAQYEVWRLAAFIRSLINSEDLTPLQIRNAFGLSVAQFNVISAKLDGYVTRYYELKNAVGE